MGSGEYHRDEASLTERAAGLGISHCTLLLKPQPSGGPGGHFTAQRPLR